MKNDTKNKVDVPNLVWIASATVLIADSPPIPGPANCIVFCGPLEFNVAVSYASLAKYAPKIR